MCLQKKESIKKYYFIKNKLKNDLKIKTFNYYQTKNYSLQLSDSVLLYPLPTQS